MILTIPVRTVDINGWLNEKTHWINLMQSFENFKKNVCLTLEDQINRFAKSVPPDQSLDFNNTINKALSYFLFDNNNEIKSLSHLNFVLGNLV